MYDFFVLCRMIYRSDVLVEEFCQLRLKARDLKQPFVFKFFRILPSNSSPAAPDLRNRLYMHFSAWILFSLF